MNQGHDKPSGHKQCFCEVKLNFQTSSIRMIWTWHKFCTQTDRHGDYYIPTSQTLFLGEVTMIKKIKNQKKTVSTCLQCFNVTTALQWQKGGGATGFKIHSFFLSNKYKEIVYYYNTLTPLLNTFLNYQWNKTFN